MIFVDQPVGTGFSYADYTQDYVTNEDQVGQDMYVFLQEFFQLFPQYAPLEFYILGESYAGHYVPAIGYRIQTGNKNKEGLHINLKGLAIGNGWVDPYQQYPAYADFAYNNGIISRPEWLADQVAMKACQVLIQAVGALALTECQLATEAIIVEMAAHLGYYPNPYDYKIPCAYPPLCYDFSLLDKWIVQPSVQKALGISPKSKWTECNGVVHTMMLGDWISNLEKYVPSLLQDYQVLVYSGELDFIFNWVGGLAWTENMNWPGQVQFLKANMTTWHVSTIPAGASKASGNLTFLKVFKAGHMVPLDQPRNALHMLNRFFKNLPFN